MNSHRPMDATTQLARLEALDEQLDAGLRRSGGGFEEVPQAAQGAPAEWVRLHELLRMPDVAVPANFADGVMARIQAAEGRATQSQRRVSPASLVAAVVGASVLLALVIGVGTGSGEQSILQTVLGGFATAALAGAGLIGATWTGVGATVGSWLGTSVTAGASLAFAALASAGAFVWSLRRRSAARQHD